MRGLAFTSALLSAAAIVHSLPQMPASNAALPLPIPFGRPIRRGLSAHRNDTTTATYPCANETSSHLLPSGTAPPLPIIPLSTITVPVPTPIIPIVPSPLSTPHGGGSAVPEPPCSTTTSAPAAGISPVVSVPPFHNSTTTISLSSTTTRSSTVSLRSSSATSSSTAAARPSASPSQAPLASSDGVAAARAGGLGLGAAAVLAALLL